MIFDVAMWFYNKMSGGVQKIKSNKNWYIIIEWIMSSFNHNKTPICLIGHVKKRKFAQKSEFLNFDFFQIFHQLYQNKTNCDLS